jgi:hypothetical protein
MFHERIPNDVTELSVEDDDALAGVGNHLL